MIKNTLINAYLILSDGYGSSVRKAFLIMQIGSVCFYEAKNSSFLFGKSEYFWKYMSAYDFYGPFTSLMAASQHFDHTMRTPANVAPLDKVPQGTIVVQPVNNVILVDFKNKRRL